MTQKFESYRAWIRNANEYIGLPGTQTHFSIKDTFYEQQARSTLRNKTNNINVTFSALDFIKQSNRIVIRGEAGSGKTTLVRYYVRYIAEKDDTAIPFYIRLFDLGKYIENKKIDTVRFDDFVSFVYSYEEYSICRITKDDLLNQFKNGTSIIFFDGFDEIDDVRIKEKVIELIRIISAIQTCKIIITTRHYAVRKYMNNLSFDIIDLEFLGYEDITKFITNIYENNSWDSKEHTPDKLFGIIKSSNYIFTFAKVPALLTCLCIVYYNGCDVPKSKSELLDTITNTLINNYVSKENERDKYKSFYEQLASLLSKDGKRLKIDKTEFIGLLAKYELSSTEEDYRREIESGILTSRNRGTIEFWHPYFQDYFYAKSLLRVGNINYVRMVIRDKTLNPEYFEAIALCAVFLLGEGERYVKTILDDICNQACRKETSNEKKLLYANLLGIIFENLEYYSFEYVSDAWESFRKHIELIIYNKAGVDPTEESVELMYRAALALGLQGKEKYRNTFISIPTHEAFLLGAQKDNPDTENYDPKCTEFEIPVVTVSIQQYEISKYPITVGEFEKFICDNGYLTDMYWSNEGQTWKDENAIYSPREWEQQVAYKNLPVSGVSWYEANAYCRWRSFNDDEYSYDLPSEAMWECAYKYNKEGKGIFTFGDILSLDGRAEANWSGCDLQRKSPVGMFPMSNTGSGICDMIGNVEEWCSDLWAVNHTTQPNDDECGAVVRGGSCIRVSLLCRPTYRSRSNIFNRYMTIGFRIIRRKKV